MIDFRVIGIEEEHIIFLNEQIADAARRWHIEMVRIGNRTENGNVRQTVTPELHDAMMNLCNILNIDAQDRAGQSGFQAMKIQGHGTSGYDRTGQSNVKQFPVVIDNETQQQITDTPTWKLPDDNS